MAKATQVVQQAEQRLQLLTDEVEDYDALVQRARQAISPPMAEHKPRWWQVWRMATLECQDVDPEVTTKKCPISACERDRIPAGGAVFLGAVGGTVAGGLLWAVGHTSVAAWGWWPLLTTAMVAAVITYVNLLGRVNTIWKHHVDGKDWPQPLSETQLVERYLKERLGRLRYQMVGEGSELRRIKGQVVTKLERTGALLGRLRYRTDQQHRLEHGVRSSSCQAGNPKRLESLRLGTRKLEQTQQALTATRTELEAHMGKIHALLDEYEARLTEPVQDISLLREVGEVAESAEDLTEQAKLAIIESVSELHQRIAQIHGQIQQIAEASGRTLINLPGFSLDEQLALTEGHLERTITVG
jgi:hypothetical protein